MDSWRTRTPEFLPLALWQEAEVCWAISLVHQLEMKLKIEGELASDQRLSIQELMNCLPVRFRLDDGTILDCVHATRVLKSIGTVLDEVCPLTWSLRTRGQTPPQHGVIRYRVLSTRAHYLEYYIDNDEVLGSDLFEHTLQQKVDRAPVTVRIPVCFSYGNTRNAGGIYDPSPEEIRAANRRRMGHFMLLMGPVISANGTPCWECQDSKGEEWGDSGFVLIRRYRDIITEFHELRA